MCNYSRNTYITTTLRLVAELSEDKLVGLSVSLITATKSLPCVVTNIQALSYENSQEDGNSDDVFLHMYY